MDIRSDDPECCCYPKGFNFDYVRVYKCNGKTLLEGKGKLGCVTKIELTPKQLSEWLRRYKTRNVYSVRSKQEP